ncbi:MAG: ACT domain-containing protein [Candidatus Omnitrophica bacterium]|nr:ACT domain-containing protein [Candidatus Omnitrophota bacterium]
MFKQINIFVENRPGRVNSIAKVLSENNINIIIFTIQDRGDFGMVKLLVDKPEQAQLILAEAGFAVALKDICVVSIEDKVGNLYKLTKILLEHKVNIIDAHGFIGPNKKGICCLEIEDLGLGLEKILSQSGFSIVSEEELYEL